MPTPDKRMTLDEMTEAAAKAAEVERLNKRHVANVQARDAAVAEASRAMEAEAVALARLAELKHHVRVPDTAVRADAWVDKGWLIVCGNPPVGNGDVDDPAQHNCDAMGCSSVSHVVIREKLDADGTLASRDALAERVRVLTGALEQISQGTPWPFGYGTGCEQTGLWDQAQEPLEQIALTALAAPPPADTKET